MCKHGLSTHVKLYIWKTVLVPILTYGLNCVNINASSLQELEKIQCKLIKASLGLPKFCNIIKANHVNLLNQIFISDSKSRLFYSHLLNSKQVHIKNTLLDNIIGNGFSVCNIIFNSTYRHNVLKKCKFVNCINHGVCDSVKFAIYVNDFNTVFNLLRPF